MNSRPHNSKSGFVLMMTILLVGVCSIALAAVYTYVSFTTRMTQIHLGNSQCRLAAQSVIEITKKDVHNAFYQHSGRGAGQLGLLSGSAFEWFESYSSGTPSTLGSGTYKVTANPTNLMNCTVVPQFYKSYHQAGASEAIVTIRATATHRNPSGTISSSTIEERIRFALMRSKVFDYAYFVNNYGWFQGSTITANGDVRANGDLYLDKACVVNGKAYGSQNSELKVLGKIENQGAFYDLRTYWSQNNPRSRPSSPAYENGDFYGGGYEEPKSAAERLFPYQEELLMPYISALDQYVDYAIAQNGTLSGGLRYYYSDTDASVKSMANATINAHYNGVGPSGKANLADMGSLVLEGTLSNPIVISGPVVVDSDVVIKGYVTGQGTIYSGRNIHIVGDIKYVNAPSWPHPDTNPDATAKVNSTKDMLGLAAKGNIIMGDYSKGTWLGNRSNSQSLAYFMTHGPYVQQYTCDESDKNIGYPRTTQYGYSSNETKFCGDYTARDGGKYVNVTTETKRVNGRNVTTVVANEVKERCYYQSVCGSKIIDALCDDTATSSSYSAKITRIDAIMYNNHGIIGHIGDCSINGSLVCRNEAMIFDGHLKINWDHRLYSDSVDSALSRMGLPMDASQPPQTLSWREVATTTDTDKP